MSIWETDKLILFIAFVVPGFIALKTYELFFPSAPIDSSKKLVDAVTYSCINYAILFWPISYVEANSWKTDCPNWYSFFYLFVFLISPVLLILVWKFLRGRSFFQNLAPHPTQKPWDFVFGQRRAYWVIVTLKNNTKIAGLFDSNSFASSAPSAEQIYLEEQWLLNDEGGFEKPCDQSAGIIILASEIVSVELMKNGEDENVRQKET